jgi:opine dehydrogenase
MRTHTSVAVLGAGHGGLALAGWLAQQGHRVVLWNRSPEPIAAVGRLGGIRLAAAGAAAVLSPVAATCSLAEALSAAERVVVALPASGHADVAWAATRLLRDEQAVLLLPGRTGGALELRRVLHDMRCRARILLGEANTFPFASRSVEPASAVIYGIKAEVLAAALPALRTPELLAGFTDLLPMLVPARSVLHTSLANVGAILHPVITVLNAGRIRAGEAFDFYTEGVTPLVAAVLAAADRERLRIAAAYGQAVSSLREWVGAAYGHRAGNLLAALASNPTYVGIKAPTTLEHRYLLDDVPNGLIPLIEMGDVVGLPSPTLRGLVARAGKLLGAARWQRARTLAVLGLAGLDVEGIRVLAEGDHETAHPPRRDVPCTSIASSALPSAIASTWPAS